jgi:uroporphyrinogen-III synthase
MVDTLAGKTIVVTRPAHQADALCDLISVNGGKPVRFPVLEISDPIKPLDPSQVQSTLSNTDLIIFISPNAVDYGMKVIASSGGFPDKVKVAAIGQGSARKLAQLGRPADVFPSDRFDSEALLAMSELQSVSGQRVTIFRGEGGREHLADTLRQRGAQVDYLECYRRVRPDTDTTELSSGLAKETIDAIVVTSNEGLQNLHDMLKPDEQQRLLNVQLFVVSERTKALAKTLGFSKTAIIINQASDQGIVDSLLQWKQG